MDISINSGSSLNIKNSSGNDIVKIKEDGTAEGLATYEYIMQFSVNNEFADEAEFDLIVYSSVALEPTQVQGMIDVIPLLQQIMTFNTSYPAVGRVYFESTGNCGPISTVQFKADVPYNIDMKYHYYNSKENSLSYEGKTLTYPNLGGFNLYRRNLQTNEFTIVVEL